ncbi:MAG TPA: helix-turn-helix transcriptional regulator [Armatimonadota bacterium]|nr:helix-turn-helix transcriptional regulator [Armatimonadota bacterium]
MPKSIYSPAYETFLRLLKESRTHAGLSQRALAARLHRPQSFVSKVELGERRCDLIEFREICRALGVDPADFLKQLEAALVGEEARIESPQPVPQQPRSGGDVGADCASTPQELELRE